MKFYTAFLLFCIGFYQFALAQNNTVEGTVINSSSQLPVGNVHIINTTQMKGTTASSSGNFEIYAAANDTLLFSYLGYETIKVRVTNDWIKNRSSKIMLTEKIYALEDVVVKRYNLTGYLEIDTKLIPVEENYRYSISGLAAGYEAGDKSPNAIGKVLRSIRNPVDFLYNTFGKRPRQMQKLKEMKKDDTIRELLATKYDRQTIAALLEIDKNDIPTILENCNYSEYFIKTANDLQILDAIFSCYEEYKILSKNK